MTTPAERSEQAAIAAHVSWGKTVDRTARTAPALRARMARFEQEADPEGVMTPQDRAKAAQNLFRADMRRRGLAGRRARTKQAAARRAAIDAALARIDAHPPAAS